MKKSGILVVLVLMLLLSSCGGLRNRRAILATDKISGESLSIKISVKRSEMFEGMMQFAINKDVHELAEMITKKDAALSATVYREKFIVLEAKSGFFLIEQVEKLDEDKENENRYYFYPPTAFAYGFKDLYMHLPYHLLTGLINIQQYWWIGYDDAYPDTTVECGAVGTVEEFEDFYNKFGHYGIKKEADSLIVTNKKTGVWLMYTFSQDENSSKLTITFAS